MRIWGQILLSSLVVWGAGTQLPAADDYKHGPDSTRQEGTPQGKVTQLQWKESKIFPGTVRD